MSTQNKSHNMEKVQEIIEHNIIMHMKIKSSKIILTSRHLIAAVEINKVQ